MTHYPHLVTCDEETEELLKQKNISPSQAFRQGVRKMALADTPTFEGEIIGTETKLNKMIKARDVLQTALLETQDELEKLKADKKND